jgi:hypothetical protein
MPANDNGDREDKLLAAVEQLVLENKLMREQVSRLVAELRTNKQKAAKRARTVRERVSTELVEQYKPTELELERARRRVLARRRS